MRPLSQCRLYTFVDTAFLHGRQPTEIARQLCDGGSDILQLRAKQETPEVVRQMAEAILPITRQAGIPLVINDHPLVATAIGAEFCHLGQEDFFDAGHRKVSEIADSVSGTQIGLSTHDPEQAAWALAAKPAYIAIGPVYATGTKPTAKPVTLEYVRWAVAHVEIPWFAIGGINLETLPEVLAAGARRICVISAILNAPDIAKACAAFRRQLT
jgi:thiamine-phosphate pyrophosphorylase